MPAGLVKKRLLQQILDIHLRYAVIVHLKHNYDPPRFWAKKV